MSGTTLVTIGTLPGASSATTNSLMFINQTPVAIGGNNQIDQVTVGSFLDQVFGSAQGTSIYRAAGSWTGLGPGTSGQFLQSNGTSANLSWGSIVGATGITITTTGGTVSAALAPIAAGDLLANTGTASAAPTATTPTALLDSAFGTTQGHVLYRGASSWAALAPSTSGYVLKTQGAGANPAWAAVAATAPGAGLVSSNGTIFETTTLVGPVSWTGGTLTVSAASVPSAGMVYSNGTTLGTAALVGATYSSGTLTVTGGGVTSIVAGGLLTGGTITSTGTIGLAAPSLGVVYSTGSALQPLIIGSNLTLSSGTLSASGGGGGGSIVVTDGIHTVSAAQTLVLFGASVSSTASTTASITVGSGISPSVVQSGATISSGSNPSVTLYSAPTTGNMLIALLSHYNNNPAVQNGYTSIYSDNGNTYNGRSAAYKFASAGESATQTPFNLTNVGNGLVIFEVTGYDNLPTEAGVIGEQSALSAAFPAFTPSYSLALGFGWQQNGSNSLTLSGLTNTGTVTSTSVLGTSMLISVAQQITTAALQNVTISQASTLTGMSGIVVVVP